MRESFDLVIYLLGSPDVSLGVAGNRGQPALAAVPGCEGAGPQLEVIHAEIRDRYQPSHDKDHCVY